MVYCDESDLSSKVPVDAGQLVFTVDDTTAQLYIDYTENGDEVRKQVGSGGGSGTVTQVSAGVGLTGGPITSSGTIKADLKSETLADNNAAAPTNVTDRQYPVVPDADGHLSVNVPWVNTNSTDAADLTYQGSSLQTVISTILTTLENLGIASVTIVPSPYNS